MDAIDLKYVGNGDWLHGVPTCDLTPAMVEDLGQMGYTRDRLITSGLYVAAAIPADTPAAIAPVTEPVKADRSARSKTHVE